MLFLAGRHRPGLQRAPRRDEVFGEAGRNESGEEELVPLASVGGPVLVELPVEGLDPARGVGGEGACVAFPLPGGRVGSRDGVDARQLGGDRVRGRGLVAQLLGDLDEYRAPLGELREAGGGRSGGLVGRVDCGSSFVCDAPRLGDRGLGLAQRGRSRAFRHGLDRLLADRAGLTGDEMGA